MEERYVIIQIERKEKKKERDRIIIKIKRITV